MASLRTKQGARGNAYVVQFYLEKKRRSLFLSAKYSRSDADETAAIVEKCVAALETGTNVDRKTLAWLEAMAPDLRTRFESAGLVTPARVLTLSELWDRYFRAEEKNFRPNTFRSKLSAERHFFKLVDQNSSAFDFRKEDVLRIFAKLDGQYCEATRAALFKDFRRVFSWAVETGLLETNPFSGVRRGSFRNKSRETFVDRASYLKMLDVCPSQEMRTLIALYRIGGLRKEEALRVEWRDVDFERGRMLIHSPKTARYAGRSSRIIPLFPELRSELTALWELVPEGGCPYVIAVNRTSNTLFKKIERIVFDAGLSRWERLIQNLRSSRAIEIFNEMGELAETEWLGHSEQTAKDHYLHVTEEEFHRATLPPSKTENSNHTKEPSKKP